MIQAAEELGKTIGVSRTCEVLGVPRSSLYQARQPKKSPAPRPTPERALSAEEKAEVRKTLNSERFWDSSPREVYATLLDEGRYHCHWRTMYRILEEYAEVRERRNQLQHPTYVKPELLATGPNQVWSWDITKLKGPTTWTYYYLYVILDIFSRYVVGWMIAGRETAKLAEELITATCAKEQIERDHLGLHADRGSPMKWETVAQLLIGLGVAKSHSRPYTPNDNPYSEAQFKTMKYQPGYPGRFNSLDEARAWAQSFFHWYNHEHHHTGLGLMTPAVVHHALADAVYSHRQRVLQAAYEAHPQRFVRGMPTPPELPKEVWINQPKADLSDAPSSHLEQASRQAVVVVPEQKVEPPMEEMVEPSLWTELFDTNILSELSKNA